MGKTEFCNALAREFALRKNKTAYGWGTIDKYGAVTRAAQMHLLGCFVFDDFVLATRGGTHKLSMEEVKHLLYTKQRGTVHAFYGDAIFPEGILGGEGEEKKKKDGIWGAHLNSSVIMRRMTDQGSWIANFPRNSLFTLSHFHTLFFLKPMRITDSGS